MEMAVRIRNAAGDGIHNAAGTAKVVTLGDGRSDTFDSTDCVLMFKKFRSVYGPSLFNTC
jgi:hypothetical protein